MERFQISDIGNCQKAELCGDFKTLIYLKDQIEETINNLMAHSLVEGCSIESYFVFIRFWIERKSEISPVDNNNVKQVCAIKFLNSGRIYEDNEMGISDKRSNETRKPGDNSGETESGWF